jgi:hypothetical protein
MTWMTLWLLGIGALSAIAWLMPSAPAESQRKLLRTYVAISCLLLAAMASLYERNLLADGLERKVQQRRIEHLGYYLAPQGPSGDSVMFRFAGEQSEGPHFSHPSLSPKDEFRLSATIGAAHVQRWVLEWDSATKPIRIHDVAVNVPEQMWLRPGDILRACLSPGVSGKPDCVGVKFIQTRDRLRLWKQLDTFVLMVPGKDPLEVSRTIISAIRASDFVKRNNSWNAAFLALGDDRWFDLLDAIILVRQRGGSAESKLGVLIAAEMLPQKARIFKNDSPVAFAGPGRQEISREDTFFYGIGARDALQLSLALSPVTDLIVGGDSGRKSEMMESKVVSLRFVRPIVWAIPPLDFTKEIPKQRFIFTSGESFVPLDGYSFQLPDKLSPFYATAHWSSDLETLHISRPYDRVDVAANNRQPVLLGRMTDGVVIGVTDAHAGVAPWLVPIIILTSGLLFCSLAFQAIEAEESLMRRISVLWVLALTLFTVRYVVAYRVSALPPLGVSPSDQEMFAGAAAHAVEGFLYPIAIVIVLAVIAAFKRPPLWYRRLRRGSTADDPVAPKSGVVEVLLSQPRQAPLYEAPPGSALSYVLLLIPSFVVLLGWAFGSRQALVLYRGLGLRINIATFLAIVFAIAVFIRWHGLDSLRSRVAAALSIWLAMGLQAIPGLIGDRGTVLVYLPCILATVLLLTLDYVPSPPQPATLRVRRRVGAVALAVSPLAIGLMMVIIDAPWQKTGDLLRIKPARGTADDLLLERGSPRLLDLDLVRANLLQQWQMKAFAAAGTRPFGYGNAPISNAGMSYATALTDCAFPTLILAEHGWGSAVLLLLLLLVMGWLIGEAGNHLRPSAANAVPLLAIGSFFAWNGLYMALSSVGRLPFTGQNVPGLSLASRGDLHQVGCLLVVAVWIICRQRGWRTRIDNRRWVAGGVVNCTFMLAAAGLLYFATVAGYSIRQEREDLQSDFNIISNANQTREFDAIARNLPDETQPSNNVKNWEFVPGSDNLKRTPSANPSSLEATLVEQYNGRADKRNGRGGLLVLVGEGQSRVVELKREHYVVASPFRTGPRMWPGSIISRSSAGLPTVCGLTTSEDAATPGRISNCFGFSLTGQGRPIDCFAGQTFNSPEPKQAPTVLAGPAARDYTCSGGGENLFQLRRTGTQIEVHTYRAAQAYVDGVPLPLNAPKKLDPYSIFSVRYRGQDKHLIYIGEQQAPIAYTTWRNGAARRLFPLGNDFPTAYALGKAADQISDSLRKEGRNQIVVTIDLDLQRQLQEYISDYAEQMEPYNDSRQDKRLAVTVLDAFSGAVRALPQWPTYDPSAKDFDEVLEKTSSRREEYMVRNANFMNHVVGSTMKPLVFSSLASQFQGTLNLGKLDFVNTTGQAKVNIVGGISLSSPWDCNVATSPTTKITPEGLLVNSYDFYEGALGVLGTLLSPADAFGTTSSSGVLRQATPANVWYDGKPYVWDMTALRGTARESAWTLGNGTQRYDFKATAMQDVLLTRGLGEVFDLPQDFGESGSSRTSERETLAADFLRGLPVNGHSVGMSAVVPDPVEVKPFRSAYPDLILCVLGGGDACRFNNVWMAQSAARIATATKVTASLIDGPDPVFAPLPKPLSDEPWRQQFLINLMQEAYVKGTAAELRHPGVKNSLPRGWKPFELDHEYGGLFKTGTLQEGVDSDGSDRESEALLFVVGRMQNGKFVRGATLAGFIYMQDSKRKVHGGMKKFGFAPGILNLILAQLRTSGAGASR